MTKRKRILFIVSRLPINTESGDRLRVYHFIRELSERGHRIDVLGFVPAGGYTFRTDIEERCEACIGIEMEGLEFENPSRLSQLKAFFGSLLRGYPYRVWLWHSKKFVNQALKMVDHNAYDVVHFSAPAAGIAFKEISKRTAKGDAPRLVYDLIDSFSLALKNSLQEKATLFWPFRLLDLFRLKRFERRVVQRADRAILISERDKDFLGMQEISIIPNGIIKNNREEQARDIDLLFVGNMRAEPNIDAAHWFAKKVMPALWEWNPELTFYITGASPPQTIQQLHNRQVNVTGYVEDIDAYYRRAKIFVCPMRLGAGQKNKILEAMINRTPVVSTAEGNIGIDAPPSAISLAETPAELCSTIKVLLLDEEKRKQLAANGYSYAASNFSWEKSADLLEQCYEN